MLKDLLKQYLRERPLFLSLIRVKEAELYQKYLPLKKPVLDVGCGDGYFAKVAFGNNLTMKQFNNETMDKIDAGLDLQDSRIEEARELNIYKKLVIYDGKKIPFVDNSYNTIVSNCVLEHVLELLALLKDVCRVLKPGGIFLTTVMAKPWENNLFGSKLLGQFYKDFMRSNQQHRNLLKEGEWNEVFQSTGFKIKSVAGYLSPKACQLIDVCHYLSLPSLLSYKMTGRWVLWPSLTRYYPIDYLTKVLSEKVERDRSGALFYVLTKEK